MGGGGGGVDERGGCVARVLLVAHPSRERRLASWLFVEGEPVGYALDRAAPEAVDAAPSWDVVVVDGESFSDEWARLRLLRRMGARPRRASVIYLCTRLPSERELEHAKAWCDDIVWPGWEQADRVRRRVQMVALAPWRRGEALRARAERLGDRRLRVLSGAREGAAEGRAVGDPGRGRVRGFVLLERAYRSGATPRMVADAFHEGRRAGVAILADAAEEVISTLRRDLARMIGGLTAAAIEDIEASAMERAVQYGWGSPVVAASFQSVEGTLDAMRRDLGQVVRGELAAIERREVGDEGGRG